MIRNDTNYLVDTKNWLKCLRWDILAPNNIVLFDSPTNYPIEMLPNDRKLRPMKLSFKLLRDTVRCCTLKYISGDWSEAVVKLYTSTRGINTQGIDNIMEHGNSIIFDNEK